MQNMSGKMREKEHFSSVLGNAATVVAYVIIWQETTFGNKKQAKSVQIRHRTLGLLILQS